VFVTDRVAKSHQLAAEPESSLFTVIFADIRWLIFMRFFLFYAKWQDYDSLFCYPLLSLAFVFVALCLDLLPSISRCFFLLREIPDLTSPYISPYCFYIPLLSVMLLDSDLYLQMCSIYLCLHHWIVLLIVHSTDQRVHGPMFIIKTA